MENVLSKKGILSFTFYHGDILTEFLGHSLGDRTRRGWRWRLTFMKEESAVLVSAGSGVERGEAGPHHTLRLEAGWVLIRSSGSPLERRESTLNTYNHTSHHTKS